MGQILARQSHYLITDVDYIPSNLERELGVDKMNVGKYKPLGFVFDKDKRELRLPRGYSEKTICAYFPGHSFVVDREGYYPFDYIDISLRANPLNDKQMRLLAFSCSKYPYEYTAKYPHTYIDADTGIGKTYVGIATTTVKKVKTVVVTPSTNSKIGNQWRESYTNFTSLRPNQILKVKGSEMCEDIIRGEYKHVMVFIVPRSTLTAFVRKYDKDWSLLDLLFKSMDVGLKIMDESHMDIAACVKIDCYTNVYRTIYMSASPYRSDMTENKINRAIIANVPRMGNKLKTKEEMHINVINMIYYYSPTDADRKDIRVRLGRSKMISQTKYSDYLLKEDGPRDVFLDTLLFDLYFKAQFRRDDGKFIIICNKRDFIEEVTPIVQEYFPNMTIGNYTGTSKHKEKELDNDIIFTTPGSLGTGAECENHQFTTNVITYGSKVLANQIPGRNRKFSGRAAIYGEVINRAHPDNWKHYQQHKSELAKKAHKHEIKEYVVSQDDINEMYDFFRKGGTFDGEGRKIINNSYAVPKFKIR